ncbi:hypothetical protein AKO1_009485, partial [Acrasis kona]
MFNYNVDCAQMLLNVVIGTQDSVELAFLMEELDIAMVSSDHVLKSSMTVVDEKLNKKVSNLQKEPHSLTQKISNKVRLVDQDYLIDSMAELDVECPVPKLSTLLEVSKKEKRAKLSDIVSGFGVHQIGIDSNGSGGGDVLTLVSSDQVAFDINVIDGINDQRCKSVFKHSKIMIMPYHSSVIRLIADYLSSRDLKECLKRIKDYCQHGVVDAKKFLACVREYVIPLLYYIIAPYTCQERHEVLVLYARVQFFFTNDIMEWRLWEEAGIDCDMLYFLRFARECDSEALYSDCESEWKREYSEYRITLFFVNPSEFRSLFKNGHRLSRSGVQEEILLWRDLLGSSAKGLDFSGYQISSKDIQVISLTCSELRELVLTGTASIVSDEVWLELLKGCPKLSRVKLSNVKLSSKTEI